MEELVSDYLEGNLSGELKQHVEKKLSKDQVWQQELFQQTTMCSMTVKILCQTMYPHSPPAAVVQAPVRDTYDAVTFQILLGCSKAVLPSAK